MVSKYILNEKLFDTDLQSNMRKALYYIDESDYNNFYFEKVIDLLTIKMLSEESTPKKEKLANSAFLASQMIAHYANQIGRNKLAIAATEYFIIKYWSCLKKDGFKKED